jgi:hypothetical protein
MCFVKKGCKSKVFEASQVYTFWITSHIVSSAGFGYFFVMSCIEVRVSHNVIKTEVRQKMESCSSPWILNRPKFHGATDFYIKAVLATCSCKLYVTLAPSQQSAITQTRLVKVIKWFSSVLRIEVSRHFKVIRVLGPWDVPTRMSQRWVTKKEWSATSNIALGQMQTMHKYKWWTKNISRCHWISVYRLILH